MNGAANMRESFVAFKARVYSASIVSEILQFKELTHTPRTSEAMKRGIQVSGLACYIRPRRLICAARTSEGFNFHFVVRLKVPYWYF